DDNILRDIPTSVNTFYKNTTLSSGVFILSFSTYSSEISLKSSILVVSGISAITGVSDAISALLMPPSGSIIFRLILAWLWAPNTRNKVLIAFAVRPSLPMILPISEGSTPSSNRTPISSTLRLTTTLSGLSTMALTTYSTNSLSCSWFIATSTVIKICQTYYTRLRSHLPQSLLAFLLQLESLQQVLLELLLLQGLH